MKLIPEFETETERLRHMVAVLEMEKAAQKLAAKALAMRLDYLERLCKKLRQEVRYGCGDVA